MAGRSATPGRGQAVKGGTTGAGPTVGKVRPVGIPGRGKKGWSLSRTLATRLPRKWGGS